MEILELELTNERRILEILAVHCTYPAEYLSEYQPSEFCAAENRARLAWEHPKVVYYAQDHGRIVGLLWLEIPRLRMGQLYSIWVDPAFRRQKLAKTLLKTAQTWLRQHDVKQLKVDLSHASSSMSQLCETLGVNHGVLDTCLLMTETDLCDS